MPTFVIDASATLPWCLRDEETAWTLSQSQNAIDRLTHGVALPLASGRPRRIASSR